MPLDEIKKGIEHNAREESRSILASAEQERDRIIEEARSSAQRIKEENKKLTDRETGKIMTEQEALSWKYFNNALLKERERIVDAEMKRLKTKIANQILQSKRYPEIFKSALKEISQIANTNGLHIIVRKEDKRFVEKAKARIELKRMSGGLLISANNDTINIDATIDHMIERHEEMIRSIISKNLFGRLSTEPMIERAEKKSGSIKKKREQKSSTKKKRKRIRR